MLSNTVKINEGRIVSKETNVITKDTRDSIESLHSDWSKNKNDLSKLSRLAEVTKYTKDVDMNNPSAIQQEIDRLEDFLDTSASGPKVFEINQQIVSLKKRLKELRESGKDEEDFYTKDPPKNVDEEETEDKGGLEHEYMRFKTMNEAQLRTRLGKITDVTKLGDFIQVAGEYGYRDLQKEARKRYKWLTGQKDAEEETEDRLEKVEELSDASLKTLIQNFKKTGETSTEEYKQLTSEASKRGISVDSEEEEPTEDEHIGFEKLVEKLKSSGRSEESAKKIAAYIGRKKYGAKKFAKMGHGG